MTPASQPEAVYYLAGQDLESQIWRLELDGGVAEQVSSAPGGVQEFSVSPQDGTLAIISGNQFYLADGDMGNPRLIADVSEAGANGDAFPLSINSPSFSPDGLNLAYGLDGLHIFHLGSGVDDHVLTNPGNLNGEVFVFAKEIYAPGPWSPDGSRLLVIMGYYEGSTLAVMDVADRSFVRLRSDGPVCCTFAWSNDSRSVLAANPNYTGDIPGLWRFDATTGEETVLVEGIAEDGSINFVGWPFQSNAGFLYFFHANLPHFDPDGGIPLELVRSASDGTELTQLRSETFTVSDVLWAPDGSFALVVEPGEDGSRLLLVPADGSAIRVLAEGEGIRNLNWGSYRSSARIRRRG